MKKFLIILGFVASLILFTGCATSQLQTSARMTQTIFINPVAQNERTIFLSMKNSSGADINLKNIVSQSLQDKGYILVNNPHMATYILMTNVLYCDKKQENNTVGGAVLGGTAGLIANSGSNGRSTLAAGVIGAVVGGLIGNATEDTIYQMQVDVLIRQRVNGGVTSTTTNVNGQANVTNRQKAGFENNFAGEVRSSDESGYLNSNMATADSQTYESNFVQHKTKIFAEATKMGLTLSEATPILEKKISAQIVGLF